MRNSIKPLLDRLEKCEAENVLFRAVVEVAKCVDWHPAIIADNEDAERLFDKLECALAALEGDEK